MHFILIMKAPDNLHNHLHSKNQEDIGTLALRLKTDISHKWNLLYRLVELSALPSRLLVPLATSVNSATVGLMSAEATAPSHAWVTCLRIA